MSQTPPTKTAAYPRAGAVPSSKLRAILEGCQGLNIIFGITVAVNIVGGQSLRREGGATLPAIIAFAIILFLLVSIGSFKYVKKVGEGLDWPESKATMVSVLLGLNSAICCGAIGFILVQMAAIKKLNEGGIEASLLKFNVKNGLATVDQMERQGL